MAILVTGGAGYIGGHAAHRLVEAGERVVVFDNLSTGKQAFVPSDAELVIGDLRNTAEIDALFQAHKIDTVMHFAASISVPESVDNPALYYQNNTAATANLAHAAARHGVKHFVFSSTAAVYGECEGEPVLESQPLHPFTPYGASKAMCERILEDCMRRTETGLVILRYFNVAGVEPAYGIGPSSRDTSHLIRVALQTALGARAEMSIFGTDYPTRDGTCIRDFVHVTDLVDAHVSALRYLEKGGETATMNVGYGTGTSVREVLEVVKSVTGSNFDIIEADRREGDAAQVVSDNSRIMDKLDWTPSRQNIERIVADSLHWERELQGELADS